MSAVIQATFVILRKRHVCERIGLSPAQIYAMLDFKSPSYDPSFPRQIRLGRSNRASAVGWLEHEVQAWLESRVQLSRGERTIHELNRSTGAKSGGVQ